MGLKRISGGLPPAAPLPAVLQTLAARWRPHEYFAFCERRYGPRFTIYSTNPGPLVVLCDPDEVMMALTAPPEVLHPGEGAAMTAALYGKHAFLLQDEGRHRAGRAIVAPAFRRSALNARDHAANVAGIAISEIKGWPIGTAIPLHGRLRAITLRVILQNVFGAETSHVRRLRECVLANPHVNDSLVVQEPRLRHLPGWRKTWDALQRQRSEASRLIQAAVQERRGATERDGLLHRLHAARDDAGRPIGHAEIADHLAAMIVAGHETTAAELAWALQLLALHPRTQDRIAGELAAGEHAYLEATITEVLRHRGVFLFAIPRKVIKPIQIGPRTYTPPVHLLPSLHRVHHQAALNHDPDRFHPDRFLTQRGTPPQWVPWGAGRRRCPGEHFATQELRITLSEILTRYRVLPTSGRLERGRWRNSIIVPAAGCRVLLAPRR